MHSLSICMIVKNEEENLKRCLDSMKNLIDKKDFVELIIVDTGSTDNTVSVAEQYTNKIYFHEWNNNFADMRNISINYAKGDWIFIIDADEELVNEEELLALLQSDDVYQNYNTILVKEKNFFDSTHKDYNIISQFRLFKNGKGFQYKGKIHNQPQYTLPIYDSNILLHHYGYINDDKVLMRKKYERTYKMIKEELENDPSNIYLWWQLSRSSAMYGKHLQAYQEIKTAFELYNKLENKSKVNYYYIFNDYARYCFKLEYYDELVNVCLEGLKYIPVNLDLLYFIAIGYEKQNRDFECIDALEAYLKAYESKSYLTFLKPFPALEINLGQEQHYEKVVLNLIQLLFKNNMYSKGQKYLHKIKNDQLRRHLMLVYYFKQKKFEDFISTLIGVKREKEILEIINVIANEKEAFLELCAKFMAIDFEYKLLFKIPLGISLTIDEKIKLTKIDFNDKLLRSYLKLIFSNDSKLIFEYLSYLNLDSKRIRDIIYDLLCEGNITKNSIVCMENVILENNVKNITVYHFLFNMYYALNIFNLKQECLLESDFVKLKHYAFAYLEQLYNFKYISRSVDYISDNVHKFFIYLSIIENYININEYSHAINYYYKALDILPEFNSLILLEIQKLQRKLECVN
jgi:glycosyltransferase involved in cell wall biosynthesis